MTTVTHEDVLAAAGRIDGLVLRTPVLEVSAGLFLKLELLQHSGSFKVRGAFNRMLSAGPLPPSGVIAASGGNHGLAVAYAARELGVRAEIFVPEVTSPVKVAGLEALGAHITQTGAIYSEAAEAAAKRAAETGALSVHAYDQAEVVAGQGTTGLEVVAQVEDVDTVVVAVGGGGFAAGITLGTLSPSSSSSPDASSFGVSASGASASGASASGASAPGVSPSGAYASGTSAGGAFGAGPRIVAVEPERIPTLHEALRAGEPVPVEVGGVAADALGATKLGSLAFEILSGPRVQSVLVSDEAIVAARRTLWARHRVAAEHAGAAAYAALLSGAYRPEEGERVAVVVCGSNTDPATLTT
ncbi:pyridoxal-phosphate dependent enzyme [Nonomuraea jiangxiensis]|uniref:threonine ammonia-lyase n=1 Tax=Nonomuraea jiangxiensis TaxID=633440 RepID=A0A1G8RG07_9ACTN|nr:pyridoxal-phosphate dependent enzyme [Nonomuraea jiangxiensis]SDJ15947.1 threonine dehydratase [Nonomuraea jiangxiensis]